jgi:RNA polymerase sigma-70 factor (ECF subfamily)
MVSCPAVTVVPSSPDVRQAELDQEQALVECARSDADAFAALYDLYVERIYRYAFRRLGTHADAEDLTAQTFRRALEYLARYDSRGAPFGAWLFRIAHNLIVDRFRARAEPLSLDGLVGAGLDVGDPAAEEIDEGLVRREQAGEAWAAVAQLPALQRRAVCLRFGRDLSHAEVGVIIGRSEPATKQLIYRAIKTLRTTLEGRA